jgi:hypothetical protein
MFDFTNDTIDRGMKSTQYEGKEEEKNVVLDCDIVKARHYSSW